METHIILIEIQPQNYSETRAENDKKIIVIPETIRVNQYSRVKWLIKDSPALYELARDYNNYGLNFTIYFDNKSPFLWKRESLRIYGQPQPPRSEDKYEFAEGIAEEKGDFKYGIIVSAVGTDEPIYDEDPYIRVF